MNINSISNSLGFKGIYTIYGPTEKMGKVSRILSSQDAKEINMRYMDATDTFEHMDTFRSLDEVTLHKEAKTGNNVGFIFTDEDAQELEFADTLDEDTAHIITNISDDIIDLNDNHIKNIL